MAPSVSRSAILRLMNAAQHTACPCHGCRTAGPLAHQAVQQMRRGMATPVDAVPKEYAFEVGFLVLLSVYSISRLLTRLLLRICALEMVLLVRSAWTSRT